MQPAADTLQPEPSPSSPSPPSSEPNPNTVASVDPSVSVAVAEGSGSKGSLSVGILVGIIVGAVAVVFLIGAGAFAAWRSAFRTRCDGGNGTADQKARQFRPEFLALGAGSCKVGGACTEVTGHSDSSGIHSAMVFQDSDGAAKVYCPAPAASMLDLCDEPSEVSSAGCGSVLTSRTRTSRDTSERVRIDSEILFCNDVGGQSDTYCPAPPGDLFIRISQS